MMKMKNLSMLLRQCLSLFLISLAFLSTPALSESKTESLPLSSTHQHQKVGRGESLPSLPRGIRNHNPGNVEKNSIKWQGTRPECSDTRFVCFDSSSDGIRAMAIILHTYSHVHNLETVEEVIERWAPAPENDTEAMRAFLRDRLKGVSRVGPDNLNLLLEALIELENGIQPYSREVIQEGIGDALSDRNFNSLRFRVDERSAKAHGNEGRSEETGTRAIVRESNRAEEVEAGSEAAQGKRISVDTEGYCNLRFPIHHSVAEGSPSLWMDRRSDYIWMDRNGRRVLVPSG